MHKKIRISQMRQKQKGVGRFNHDQITKAPVDLDGMITIPAQPCKQAEKNSVHQSAILHNPRLSLTDRQLMAQQIARLQGNLHLTRLVNKPDEDTINQAGRESTTSPGVTTEGAPSRLIQRWSLEGPWNIGEPVHEELTAKALRAAKIIGIDDTYTDKEAWEYVRGALWNDDPEGLLFDNQDWLSRVTTTKYSSGVAFGSKFKQGEKQAEKEGAQFGPEEISLLKRSHFGDLQFLHGMAVQGEKAAETQANMLKWAEFTYKIGAGEISGDTLLQNVPVSGIPELFPKLKEGTTVEMLFGITAGLKKIADVKKRAIGSLMHMVQDTYATSHTEREMNQTTPGSIKEFHSYTGQEKEKHAEKDTPEGYSEAEFKAREKSIVDATSKILQLVNSGEPWEGTARPEIEAIFGLVEKPSPASPGVEFKG